ncbi:fasciclin domain-containing protein [Dictyobacter aurantiacus]|uniref:FAS1 domain-containing protein n=1 Tax=Dictyobacter aurantiacus TaxID=1936993 RepID=A0A401ZNX5_9CHLR|nr:fasciclin domain-containing protein [Dictyobacter aurantiacus]GCE08446.1 hypothetical protein KDAU_57750 [Dictyobacter aurantiacus]
MKDINDLLLSRTTHFTFISLHTMLKACGLNVDLENYAGRMTLFAPPDAAFDRLRDKGLDLFDMTKDIDNLRRLLTFHMVPLRLTQADLRALSQQGQAPEDASTVLEVETVSGHALHVTLADHLMVENANVLHTDLIADNGIVHVIDSVLWPPDLTEESFHASAPFHRPHDASI